MNPFLTTSSQYKLWPQLKINNNHYFPVWKFFFCVFPLLAGCAALTTQTTAVKTIFTKPRLSGENTATANFNLLGRVSIRDESQRFSAGVRWQHTGINDEIQLLSPLGQAVAQIEQDKNGVRLITSEKKVYYATDVETLTEDILGWRLPLNGLQYWIQGTHSPATASAKDLDKEGRVVAIRQDGWQILFSRYLPTQAAQITRPKILELNYQDLSIRLVIDNWESE